MLAASRSPPSLLHQQPQHASAHGLPIEDAWLIAAQWHSLLQNKVLLERSADESDTKSYAWIRFEINSGDRNEVSAARAAAVAWFGLSCCPGYGGDENPVFWKCVFSELTQLHLGESIQANQSITDACGFFDGDGMDFPRFKLNASRGEANVSLFCGDPGEELEADDRAKLVQVVESLAPWIDPTRTSRRPVVSLAGLYSKYSCTNDSAIAELESQRPKEWPLSRFITWSNQYTGSGWPSPVFVVKELDIQSDDYLKDATKQQWFYEIMSSHEVEMSTCPWHIDIGRNLSHDALAMTVRDVLRLRGSSCQARTTELHLPHRSACASAEFASVLPMTMSLPFPLVAFSLPAFASALPMTTSIQRVRVDDAMFFDRYYSQQPTIDWIAYALFHPDTPTTPWQSLILDHEACCVPVLKGMARGNNLAAVLKGREPTSDGYYRARLASNASVYDYATSSVPDRIVTMVTSDGTLDVEVCGVWSDDPATWTEWVAVVVPAYGLGWARSADVTSVVKRAPASSFLKRFVVRGSNSANHTDATALGGVLSVIGHRLEHLDIHQCGAFASQSELVQTLSCCPSLKSLVVKYQADVWDSEAVARVLPRLRELELHVVGPRVAVFNVPPSLHLLRITTVSWNSVYQASADAVRHILTQPSQLRVFHWEEGLQHAHHQPTSYTHTCFDTKKRLEALGLCVESTECVDVRLPAACAAAFLSVIGHGEGSSAVAQLDVVMAMIIVEFAGSRVKRSIVLEPAENEVRTGRNYRCEHYRRLMNRRSVAPRPRRRSRPNQLQAADPAAPPPQSSGGGDHVDDVDFVFTELADEDIDVLVRQMLQEERAQAGDDQHIQHSRLRATLSPTTDREPHTDAEKNLGFD